ncbi:hypothetical protein H0Z60_15240 [Ectothiorhodospiraceae bacterium WFHF3C12]|nr:hypothetical protein [Ectothiorhodospiraceae bacterium WFHF3C12]
MKALAGFVMRGRWTAPVLMVATALVPVLAWLGGASLALATLRRGAAEGALAAGLATAGLAAVALASGAPGGVALGTLLEFWLPLWLVAVWLRWSVSLASAVQVAGALAAVGVAGFYLWFGGDPGSFWSEQLAAAGRSFGIGAEEQAGWEAFSERLQPVMTGLWALNLLGLVVVSLLLGRWWQALLYNPGGFRAEFHELRLDRGFAVATALVILAGTFTGRGLATDAGLVLSSVFVFQALAVAHWVAAARAWNRLGLVVVYVLLPVLFQVYALIGIVDVFIDVRRRMVSAGGS